MRVCPGDTARTEGSPGSLWSHVSSDRYLRYDSLSFFPSWKLRIPLTLYSDGLDVGSFHDTGHSQVWLWAHGQSRRHVGLAPPRRGLAGVGWSDVATGHGSTSEPSSLARLNAGAAAPPGVWAQASSGEGDTGPRGPVQRWHPRTWGTAQGGRPSPAACREEGCRRFADILHPIAMGRIKPTIRQMGELAAAASEPAYT